MVRNISLQLYRLPSLGPKLSDLALASEACRWSQTRVCALLSSPNWWQPCSVDLMRWGQIKARICNVRSVFPGEKTKIADMPLSHSPAAQPGPGSTSKAILTFFLCSGSDSLPLWLHACAPHELNNGAIMLLGEEGALPQRPGARGKFPRVQWLCGKWFRLCFSFSSLYFFQSLLSSCQTLALSPYQHRASRCVTNLGSIVFHSLPT